MTENRTNPPQLQRDSNGFLLNWREIDEWACANSHPWKVIRLQMRGRSEGEVAVLLAAYYMLEAQYLRARVEMMAEGRVGR